MTGLGKTFGGGVERCCMIFSAFPDLEVNPASRLYSAVCQNTSFLHDRAFLKTCEMGC